MAYVTGTASSLAALLTALRNACTTNGWALSGNVLHKGGCYAETLVGSTNDDTGIPANWRLIVRAGNGIDGANALTDAPASGPRLGPLIAANEASWPDWDWPVAYHIHIHDSPDEVYMFVNYGAGAYFQHVGFGKSPSPGNAGTGNWQTGSIPSTSSGSYRKRVNGACIAPDGGSLNYANQETWCPAPFFWGQCLNLSSEMRLNSQMHGAIGDTDGLPDWSNYINAFLTSGSGDRRVSSAVPIRPLMGYIPNAWNNEAVLLPCQVLQVRPESKSSLIGELKHLRFTRNDFIDPGAVITLGPDKWKVYPCYRKELSVRNGGAQLTHSGTIAMAIRYDGP
ncbi:MAG TPA: hypothetical protein VIT90_15415 [Lysobacter sp.]